MTTRHYVSDMAYGLQVCQAEKYSRCDLIGPYRVAPIHLCDIDDGHDGGHECACGHRCAAADA